MPHDASDEALTGALQHGPAAEQQEAFCRLYDRYAGPLQGYLQRLSGQADLAADLTQEAFLRAYTARERFRGQSSFRTWVYRIAINLYRDHQRKDARLISSEHVNAESQDSAPGPAETARRNEEAEQVRRAVAALREDWREAVLLVRLEGMSYAAAAAVLETTVETVRMRVHRGHLALVGALGHLE